MMKLFWLLFVGVFFMACQTTSSAPSLQGSGGLRSIEVLRLLPDSDPRTELLDWAKAKNIKAASVLSAVGSLSAASLRFANEKDAKLLVGPFEIVSLSGLVSESGLHVHLSISDSRGQTVGGHLGQGSKVHTTLELVIGVYDGVEFLREHDPKTGYNELFIR